MTLVEQINAALDELELWVKGEATTWNQNHGSVTGDYENQWTNTKSADSARIIALSAKITGLSALLAFEEARRS